MPGVREIAQAAQVSIATVSRVLSGAAGVSEDARRRVRAASAALNYRPEAARRGRPKRRHAQADTATAEPLGGQVLLLVPGTRAAALHDRTVGYFAYVFSGLMKKAQEAGVTLNLTPYAPGTLPDVLGAPRVEAAQRAGARGVLLLFTTRDEDRFLERAKLALPCLALNRALRNARVTVRVDERGGARAAAEHLLELGHRRIGVLAGPARYAFFEERLAGVREALAAAGRKLPTSHVARAELSPDGGRASARTLLALRPRPTALFAAEEDFAAGALAEAQAQGLRVPRDVSLAAFSDFVLSARGAAGPGVGVTAVRVPAFEMGYLGLEALLNAARLGVRMRQESVLETALVVRRSAAAPKRA
ncbi:MAG: LacI family transcriptional regulator [Planctomycetes bacterium]|nr:LacI family transcriptional regulator [Planctomycetota bacterium]